LPTEFVVIPTESYEYSVRTLAADWPQLNLVLERLIERLQRFPDLAPRIAGTHARIIRTRATLDYPAVSLIYRTKQHCVFLYLVTGCDPLMDAVDRGHA
jgi:hypothetical protein